MYLGQISHSGLDLKSTTEGEDGRFDPPSRRCTCMPRPHNKFNKPDMSLRLRTMSS